MKPLHILGRFIMGPLLPLWDRMAPLVAKGMTRLGMGKILYQHDEHTQWRVRPLWEEARKRGITMYEFRPFGLPKDLFVARKGNWLRSFEGLPRPRNYRSASLDWMDDKARMRSEFIKAGTPVARGGVAYDVDGAIKLYRKISHVHEEVQNCSAEQNGASIVVKPSHGSRSRHTYTGITSEKGLIAAFHKAKQLSPWVVVEEELQGMVYRGTLIGGKLQGVARREPAHVVGDGVHTIQELMNEENKNPLRKGPLFSKLDPDMPWLMARGVIFNSAPRVGEVVILHPKISFVHGGGVVELLEHTHPDNVALMHTIGVLLNDAIVGVDFILGDITQSWRLQPRSGVIECNSLPFIDMHHYVMKGIPKNVAGALWDLVGPQ